VQNEMQLMWQKGYAMQAESGIVVNMYIVVSVFGDTV